MASAPKYVLSIDLGTSGPKVALFTTRGELIDSEFEPNGLQLLPDGGAEQSPQEWWRAIGAAVKRMLGRGRAPREQVVAVGITGQWAGTVPLDRQGNVLGSAIIWIDSRGEPYTHLMMDGLIKVAGFSLPKLLRWIDR